MSPLSLQPCPHTCWAPSLAPFGPLFSVTCCEVTACLPGLWLVTCLPPVPTCCRWDTTHRAEGSTSQTPRLPWTPTVNSLSVAGPSSLSKTCFCFQVISEAGPCFPMAGDNSRLTPPGCSGRCLREARVCCSWPGRLPLWPPLCPQETLVQHQGQRQKPVAWEEKHGRPQLPSATGLRKASESLSPQPCQEASRERGRSLSVPRARTRGGVPPGRRLTPVGLWPLLSRAQTQEARAPGNPFWPEAGPRAPGSRPEQAVALLPHSRSTQPA